MGKTGETEKHTAHSTKHTVQIRNQQRDIGSSGIMGPSPNIVKARAAYCPFSRKCVPFGKGGIRPHRRPSSHSASQPAVNLATSSLSEKKHSLADSVNQNSRLHPEIGHRRLWARKGTQ